MRNGSTISPQGIFRFFHRQFRDFSLIHLLLFLNPQTNCLSKVFHNDFCLFHFLGKHLRSHHGTKGEFGRLVTGQFLGQRHGQGRLSSPRSTDQKQRTTRQLLGNDQIGHDAQGFPGLRLTNETARRTATTTTAATRTAGPDIAFVVQTEARNVSVHRYSARRRHRRNRFNLHGR